MFGEADRRPAGGVFEEAGVHWHEDWRGKDLTNVAVPNGGAREEVLW